MKISDAVKQILFLLFGAAIVGWIIEWYVQGKGMGPVLFAVTLGLVFMRLMRQYLGIPE